MRVLTVQCFAAPSSRAWTVDRDSVLVGASTTAGNVLISLDPSMTTANFSTPSAEAKPFFDYYVWLGSGSGVGGISFRNMKIPIVEGSALYVANSAICSVMIVLDDVT